ncbi:MAG: hypothetical protein LKJ83_03895 [Eubacteriaceae bacterium]|jgi:hypothetical protein|nr:hypothetical protein [Eubacteriaceae bacterium]
MNTNVKRNTSRLFAAVLAVMMVFVFTACGAKYADSPYVGTWTSDKVTMYGITISYDMEMDIKDTGKFSFKAGEDDGNGSWEIKDDKFYYEDSGTSIEGTIKNDKLHVTFTSGGSSFTSTMTKK